MDAALRELATLDLDGTTVLVDPGDLTGCETEAIVGLLDSLGRLGEETAVVVSTNAAETATLAAVAGSSTSTSASTSAPVETVVDRLDGIRDRAGLAAAVSHERERAVAATPGGSVRVPSVEAPRVERRTGAGDRFDGAFAAGLAADWGFSPALALANACASYFVSTARTARPDDLVAYLRDVPLAGCDER